jgi:hypothetical protein
MARPRACRAAASTASIEREAHCARHDGDDPDSAGFQRAQQGGKHARRLPSCRAGARCRGRSSRCARATALVPRSRSGCASRWPRRRRRTRRGRPPRHIRAGPGSRRSQEAEEGRAHLRPAGEGLLVGADGCDDLLSGGRRHVAEQRMTERVMTDRVPLGARAGRAPDVRRRCGQGRRTPPARIARGAPSAASASWSATVRRRR